MYVPATPKDKPSKLHNRYSGSAPRHLSDLILSDREDMNTVLVVDTGSRIDRRTNSAASAARYSADRDGSRSREVSKS